MFEAFKVSGQVVLAELFLAAGMGDAAGGAVLVVAENSCQSAVVVAVCVVTIVPKRPPKRPTARAPTPPPTAPPIIACVRSDISGLTRSAGFRSALALRLSS